MNKAPLIIAGVAVLAVGAYLLYQQQNKAAVEGELPAAELPAPEAAPAPMPAPMPEAAPAPMPAPMPEAAPAPMPEAAPAPAPEAAPAAPAAQ